MRSPASPLLGLVAALLLGACANIGGDAAEADQGTLPGGAADEQPFDLIGADEQLRFLGNEPFWGGEVQGTRLTWTTPENIDGEAVSVTRFAGRGGLSYSGTLQGQGFDMAITPAQCSDGMSDRTYPFAVTVRLGEQMLNGCAWSERQGYSGGPE